MPFKSKFLKSADDDRPNLQEVTEEDYGQEVVLDIHDVPEEFFQVKEVRHFAEQLCDEIGMKRGPLYTWGENKDMHKGWGSEGTIKANGISCVQFLYSSSITIHALDEIHKVFVNVFSCKPFDAEKTKQFAMERIGGKIVNFRNTKRE